MTDDTTPENATQPEDEPFVVMPTAAWAHDIESRLQTLEHGTDQPSGNAPVGGLSPDQEARVFAALKNIDDRLSRHRSELEGIKTHQNELGEYVEQHLPIPADAAPPPAPTASVAPLSAAQTASASDDSDFL